MTREQYITVQAMLAGIRAADSGFASDAIQKEWTIDERIIIEKELADSCSRWQLENTITLLQSSLNRK